MIGDKALGWSAAIAVMGYKRFVSPRKSFKCPHHRVHGEGSCSDFGLYAFTSLGFFEGWRRLKIRFSECKAAAITLANPHSGSETSTSGSTQGKNKEKTHWSDYCAGADCSMLRFGGGKKGGADGDLGGFDCSPDCSF